MKKYEWKPNWHSKNLTTSADKKRADKLQDKFGTAWLTECAKDIKDKEAFLCFESLESFLECMPLDLCEANHEGGYWTAETWSEFNERIHDGYTGAVPDAEKLLAEIDANIDTTGLIDHWQDSVVGAFPNVPAFLAGSPECMRSFTGNSRNTGKKSPIKVVYSPIVSASTDAETIKKRGIVVLALVMALSRVRPVELEVVTCLGNMDSRIRLKSAPLMLSETAYVLTNPTWFRSLAYTFAHASAAWDGGWGAWSGGGSQSDEGVAHMRKCLGLQDDDLFISPLHCNDNELMDNPVKYINGVLDQYRNLAS